MRKDLLRWLVFVVWALVLLVPMMAPKLGFDTFELDFARPMKLVGMLALAGLCVVAYRAVRGGKEHKVRAPRNFGIAEKLSTPWAWAAAGVLTLSLPFWADNYTLDIAINVLIYITLGLGLNVVVGLAGLLDLGYIAFYAVGAYTYALLNTIYGVPFWLALPAGCVISAGAGAFIGYPTLKMRGDYLAIVTLGFGEIVRIVLNNWDNVTQGPNGVLGIKAPGIYIPEITDGSLDFVYFYMNKLPSLYYVILLIAIVTIIGVQRIDTSRIGRAWVSIREDETAAELTGIQTLRYKMLAYMMGAVFAGLAGAFYAAKVRYVNPSSFVFLESALVLCIVVLGGMGSIPGIILGAAAIIVLPEVFRELELYRLLAFGGAMTAMVIFRPEGLIPARRRQLELHIEETFADEDDDA